ncbi:MAG: molybdopterin molybdotransferase MoeA [Sulfolobales archaeon]
MVSLEEARRRISRAVFREPSVVYLRPWEAMGMIAADHVRALRDVPEVRVSAMDGYAVRSKDLERYRMLKVVGKLFPGDAPGEVGEGEAFYVSTGAPIPRGADAVVRLEATRVVGGYIAPVEDVWSGKDIVEVGDVVRRGDIIVRRGEIISPYAVGLMIRSGVGEVPIYRIRIGLIAVGDELSRFDMEEPGIKDHISPIIIGLASFAEKEYLGVVRDDVNEISRILRHALSKTDIVITLGGTSVGEKDLVKKAVSQVGELLFEGVDVNVIKRGSVAISDGKPIIILPGQCVSSVACYHEHGLHVISRMVGNELRVFEKAVLGSEIDARHKMHSLYLFKLEGGKAYPLRWGPGQCLELLRADAMGVIRRDQRYRVGDEITLQRLIKIAQPITTYIDQGY